MASFNIEWKNTHYSTWFEEFVPQIDTKRVNDLYIHLNLIFFKFLSYFILELPNKERSENEPLSVLLTYFADTAGEV